MTESRKMKWVMHIARISYVINAYEIITGKSEMKRTLGRTRCELEDNIEVNLKEIVFEVVRFIHLGRVWVLFGCYEL
jgi:hypothetical protein